MINFFKKFLITFFFLLILFSFIYEHFLKASLYLNITTPNGEIYTLSFNNLDLIMMSINGILKNINLEKGLNNTEKVGIFAEKINELIIKNKEYYMFYYLEFQKFYPERYFILCIEDSCDYFFFSISGLIRVENRKDVNIDKILVVWINEKYLDNLIKLVENKDKNILFYFKEGIIKGKFKVMNTEKVVERILEKYKV